MKRWAALLALAAMIAGIFTGMARAADLELAYAVTVHKSQGSEFDAVILPLFRTMPQLCYRNLLYTAVTRARSLLILVGERKTVEAMVQNDRKTLRYSALWALLAQKGGEAP